MADLEGTAERSTSVGKDLFSGAMGGIAQVMLGMCFLLVFVIFGSKLASNCCFFEVTGVSRASKKGNIDRFQLLRGFDLL